MKELVKLVTLSICLLGVANSFSQEIIPVGVGELYQYVTDDNTLYYIKDTQNYLSPFVGVWEAETEFFKYEFHIKKGVIQEDNIKEDLLLMRYIIWAKLVPGAPVLVSTLDLPDDDLMVISGMSYDTLSRRYSMYYWGVHGKCGQNGTVFIDLFKTNQVRLKLSRDGDLLGCEHEFVSEFLPTDWVFLKKKK